MHSLTGKTDPNCIKFRPATAAGGEDDADRKRRPRPPRRNYSEARTTRHVRAGEALTLHYVENPREVSHATRRKMLWDQHRFDIGDGGGGARRGRSPTDLDDDDRRTCDIDDGKERRGRRIYESELVRGKFPPSSTRGGNGDDPDDGAPTGGEEGGDDYVPTASDIERSLDGLECILVELGGIFGGGLSSPDDDAGDGTTNFERAAALELAIGEMISASASALGNDRHILLSRCRRLHLDVVEMLLKHCPAKLTHAQSVGLIARSLPSAASLLECRISRLGNDHPDVARTYHDLALGIRALLSNSPRKLLSLGLRGMTTLDDCSRMEHRCRSEKDRIDGMYPRDVECVLSSVRRK